MTIHSIEIKNLLSFDRLKISDLSDINCIVGKNNSGKSNLLKLISFFYSQLEGKREIPPELNSSYSVKGSITIEYDTTRIRKIVTARSDKNGHFFKHIYNTLFGSTLKFSSFLHSIIFPTDKKSTYKLTLFIHKNNSIQWSTKNKDVLGVVAYLYPFFEIQTRHIDLYDWDKLWDLISRLKSFNIENIDSDRVIEFFNEGLSKGGNGYADFVGKIQDITQTRRYSYRERVLNYVKVGLQGHTFTNDGEALTRQSDGTNSYRYIEIFINLLISLTRRDYISPFVYIDEPEIGLHPKLNEKLIDKIHQIYSSFKKTKSEKEQGRYATPYPKIFFSTHSPNILKQTIKRFPIENSVFHFSKEKDFTVAHKMNSQYKDIKFINIFDDAEARLFFSELIIFVEGESELELFRNRKLCNRFSFLEAADVYSYNTVSLKGLNPNFSNASIPHLVLCDLDALVVVDFQYGKVSLSKKIIDLKSVSRKYNRAYFGSRHYEIKRNIERVLAVLDGGKVVFGENKLVFDKIEFMGDSSFEGFVVSFNEKIFRDMNVFFNKTTIEGVLINEASFNYFLRWLIYEIFYGLSLIDNENILRQMDSIRRKGVNMNSFDEVVSAMNSLLCGEYSNVALNDDQNRFIISLKRRYVFFIAKELSDKFPNRYQAMVALRLIFRGKTETLVALDNENIKCIDQNFIRDVRLLQKKLFPLKFLQDKTSGWISRFINFSMDKIEKESKKTGFIATFSVVFPELHDIIRRLQSR